MKEKQKEKKKFLEKRRIITQWNKMASNQKKKGQAKQNMQNGGAWPRIKVFDEALILNEVREEVAAAGKAAGGPIPGRGRERDG